MYDSRSYSIDEAIKLYQRVRSPGKDVFNSNKKYFDEDFDDSFDTNSLINQSIFTNCRFVNTEFLGTSSAYTNFIDCLFAECNIQNANMTFCDFTGSQFLNSKIGNNWKANDFSYSLFQKTKLDHLQFEGTSFYLSSFPGAQFNNLDFYHCCFDSAIFEGTTFSSTDFSDIEVHSCKFSNNQFNNTVFTLTMALNNYGLIPAILNKTSGLRIVIGGNHEDIDHNTAIDYLSKLIVFFEANNEYFPLCNICLHLKEPTEALETLKRGLQSSIEQLDFVLLLRLCKLATYSKAFPVEVLHDIYKYVEGQIDTNTLKHNDVNKYLQCMGELRYLLLLNPEQSSTLQLIFKTNISDENTEDLGALLSSIEKSIGEIDSDANPMFQIQRHSPYEVLVTVCATASLLLPISQFFYYIVSSIKSGKDIFPKKKRDKQSKENSQEQIIETVRSVKSISIGKFSITLTSEQAKSFQSIEHVSSIIDDNNTAAIEQKDKGQPE